MDLNLKELIRSVQKELEDSQQERQNSGQPSLFKVEELTVELAFAIVEQTAAKGGFGIKILELGASNTVTENETHKLILKMSAVHSDKPSVDASTQGRDPRIQEALGLYPSKQTDPSKERDE